MQTPAKSQVMRVKESGRIGAVLKHDPSDKDLTWKLQFSDGLPPFDDWHPEGTVEEVPPLIVTVHSASLVRSFSKLHQMSPYAVVKARPFRDDEPKEVFSTDPHDKGHQKPSWDATHNLEDMPLFIDVEVWDKRTISSNVFCGSATIPTNSEALTNMDFELTKKGKSTGSVRISMRPEKALSQADGRGRVMSKMSQATVIGDGFDKLFNQLNTEEEIPEAEKVVISLQPSPELKGGAYDKDAGDEEAVEESPKAAHAAPSAEFAAKALVGMWKCVDTKGLDAYLKETGARWMDRKIAASAKWPAWEFYAEGDVLEFNNHSMIGIIKESIQLNKEYEFTDGRQNVWKTKTTWTPSADGGTLLQERQPAASGRGMASYKEERIVTGDRLEFTLSTSESGISWGRTFERNDA